MKKHTTTLAPHNGTHTINWAKVLDELRAITPGPQYEFKDYYRRSKRRAMLLRELLGVNNGPVPSWMLKKLLAMHPPVEGDSTGNDSWAFAHRLHHLIDTSDDPIVDTSCLGAEGLEIEELDELLAEHFASNVTRSRRNH